MNRKKVTVTPAALKAAGRKNTKASARLEGREVPVGFVRSPAAERYIAECGSRTFDTLEPVSEPNPADGEMVQPGTGVATEDLLSFLKTEIWPLLGECSPITKAERETILDDPTGD